MDTISLLKNFLGKNDDSEILFFIFKHKIFRYPDVKLFDTNYLSPYDKEFSSYKFKHVMLLIYLYSLDKELQYKDWGDKLWNVIIKLSKEEFLRFWLEFGLIRNKNNKLGYDSQNKDYIFVNDFDTFADQSEILFLIGKIKERLKELKEEGFKFEFES